MKIKAVKVAHLPFYEDADFVVAVPVRLRVNSKILAVTYIQNAIWAHFLEPDPVEFNGAFYEPTILWTWHLKIAGEETTQNDVYVGTVAKTPNDIHVFATLNDDVEVVHPEPIIEQG